MKGLFVSSVILLLHFVSSSNGDIAILRPQLEVLSAHKVHSFENATSDRGKYIDIEHGSELRLRCSAPGPVLWVLPNNHHPYSNDDQYGSLNISTPDCDHSSVSQDFARKCVTELVISDIQFGMTGLYRCVYNTSRSGQLTTPLPTPTFHYPNQILSAETVSQIQTSFQEKEKRVLFDEIYVFVNDVENLIVPYEGSPDYYFIAVFQSHPATLPCRPTHSRTKVSLWMTHTRDGAEVEIKPDPATGITFDPRKGFHFASPKWDTDANILECRFELDEQHQKSASITLHWSVLPSVLHPVIDDSLAKHVYLNRTFQLTCSVNMDIGVIVILQWDYPNRHKQDKRIVRSGTVTTRTKVDQYSYDTVSMNLTVHNARESDSGEYFCNATDGKGKVFSSVKHINVVDERIPPRINLTLPPQFASYKNRSLMFQTYDDIQLTFLAEAFPDVSVFDLNWYRDGQRLDIANNSQYQVEVFSEKTTSVSLNVLHATAIHSGTYTLVANASRVSSNISLSVIVSGEPEIVIEGNRRSIQVDDSLTILCKAYGFPLSQVWWSWIDCEQNPDCFNRIGLESRTIFSNADQRWKNVSECDQENNEDQFCSKLSPVSSEYLSQTLLFVNSAKKTGVLRCSAVNEYNVLKHFQIPFVVSEDSSGWFSVISSPEEPIINDTVALTCRANVFLYSSVNWRIGENARVNDTYDNSSAYTISSTILIPQAQIGDSATFVCEARNREYSVLEKREIYLSVKNASPPSIVESNMKNEVIQKSLNSQFELRCFIAGRPKPLLRWTRDGELFDPKDDSGVQIVDSGQRVIFSRLLAKDSGKYECFAQNRAGSVIRSAYLVVEDSLFQALSTSDTVIIILILLLTVTLLLIAIILGRKFKEHQIRKRELELFSQEIFQNGQMDLFNPDIPLDEQIDLLPYDSRYEFPKENLRLGRTLGQGAFGRVVKAEAIGIQNEDETTTVAVKMLKEHANADHRKALMAELKILIHLGRHVNIVNLLGAVTQNISKGELLVIVEFCEFGNLRDFLLANRDNFTNDLFPSCGLGEYQNVPPMNQSKLDYQNSWKTSKPSSVPTVAFTNHNYISGTASVTMSPSSARKTAKRLYSLDLLDYAFQAARGMEYLTERKLIHRDLAARNVLLDSNYVVKICDFGLAKDVYKDDNYVKRNSGPLPIKWMSIESMRDKVFTTKSDVWSFGVLLWEIFSLGRNPYPGVEVNEEFFRKLIAGYRMEKPEFMSDELYRMVLRCWDYEPGLRPTFSELVDFIGSMLPPDRRQELVDLNAPYSEMNDHLRSEEDYMKMSSVPLDDFASEMNDPGEDYLQMQNTKGVEMTVIRKGKNLREPNNNGNRLSTLL